VAREGADRRGGGARARGDRQTWLRRPGPRSDARSRASAPTSASSCSTPIWRARPTRRRSPTSIRTRFFQLGIAEGNMVGVAAGLALAGKIPSRASFACFLAGRFEQIRVSVAYNRANVRLVGTHAGIGIGEDGYTQMGLEDVALMRSLPNMAVVAASRRRRDRGGRRVSRASRWPGLPASHAAEGRPTCRGRGSASSSARASCCARDGI
jgi:hypothetical protein